MWSYSSERKNGNDFGDQDPCHLKIQPALLNASVISLDI